jgi:hypothetical protein
VDDLNLLLDCNWVKLMVTKKPLIDMKIYSKST